jgi:hypothetical protein
VAEGVGLNSNILHPTVFYNLPLAVVSPPNARAQLWTSAGRTSQDREKDDKRREICGAARTNRRRKCVRMTYGWSRLHVHLPGTASEAYLWRTAWQTELNRAVLPAGRLRAGLPRKSRCNRVSVCADSSTPIAPKNGKSAAHCWARRACREHRLEALGIQDEA